MSLAQYAASNYMKRNYFKGHVPWRRNNAVKCTMPLKVSERGRIISVFAGLVNFKSIYSVSQISQSPSFLGKIVWFLVFTATFLGSVYKIYEFYCTYFQYPIVLSFHASLEQNLTFPAVTLCNLNRMGINGSLHVNYGANASIGTPLIFSERRSLQYCRKLENGTVKLDSKNELAMEFLMKYYGMNETERFKMGIHPSGFLQECSFNGKRCAENLLSNFGNFRFGNCVTFNKKIPNMVPLRVSKTGINTGLAIKLFLITALYHDTVHTFGAKVVIHDPSERPNPEDDGFFISPGHDTAISLKQTLYRRLPNPYKDRCRNYEEAETNSSIRNKNDCIRACIQQKCYEKCGCIDPSLGITDSFRPCNLTNPKESCCLNEVLDTMAQSGSPCDCPLPCASLYYNEEISRSLLVSRAKKLRGFYRWYVKNDWLRLKIFYSSMEKRVFEQKPKWEESELLSHIGNELALWLGLSVVAAFELLENLILFVKNVCLLCQ